MLDNCRTVDLDWRRGILDHLRSAQDPYKVSRPLGTVAVALSEELEMQCKQGDDGRHRVSNGATIGDDKLVDCDIFPADNFDKRNRADHPDISPIGRGNRQDPSIDGASARNRAVSPQQAGGAGGAAWGVMLADNDVGSKNARANTNMYSSCTPLGGQDSNRYPVCSPSSVESGRESTPPLFSLEYARTVQVAGKGKGVIYVTPTSTSTTTTTITSTHHRGGVEHPGVAFSRRICDAKCKERPSGMPNPPNTESTNSNGNSRDGGGTSEVRLVGSMPPTARERRVSCPGALNAYGVDEGGGSLATSSGAREGRAKTSLSIGERVAEVKKGLDFLSIVVCTIHPVQI